MMPTTSRPLMTRIALALLWLFVFSLPLTHATEIPAIGMISKVTGLIAMAAGAIAVATSREIRLLAPVHMAMASFILWSAITLCWSVTPDLTVQRIMTYLQLFVLVLLIWELCSEESNILHILDAFVLGTIFPALSTLKAFLPGQQTLYQRAGSDSNSLAFTLALSLPVAYYLILRGKSGIPALYRLQMGFAVCAILLSGSAATMIAMVAGLSLIFWTIHVVPARTRTNAVVVVMLLGGAALLFVPATLWQHIAEESRNGGITMTAVVDGGIQSVRSTPLGGFGAGSMDAATRSYPGTATTSFTMFSEIGVMGVICFVVMLGILFLSAERMSGTTRSFWFTVLAVWTVGACALNWECSQPAWLLFGLLAAHASCPTKDAVEKAERERKQNYYVENAEVWS